MLLHRVIKRCPTEFPNLICSTWSMTYLLTHKLQSQNRNDFLFKALSCENYPFGAKTRSSITVVEARNSTGILGPMC